ncbi:uracil-DNA glycosylase [Ruminococcaceae bacterium OttesenSCG-928-L11]|nr:uracil-DNA glycosylase [Ruminococcaceae bacterium OttesenSCG-928-L11]
MHPELEAFAASIADCTGCGLCEGRKQVVFGTGNPHAKIMLVGEGPGANEDKQGEPFVGQAGMLLDKMLIAAGFSRKSNVYIANVVKCRPPQNRDPAAEEISACLDHLREQFRIIRPQIVVCLGRIAAQTLINPNFRVTREHGQFTQKNGVWFMGTYHPAALLRYPANKVDSFADLLQLRDLVEELGLCELDYGG